MGTTRAGIILVGDEILSGKVVDENARYLIEELRQLGVSLQRISVIPDVLEDIAATVREFSGRFDHVFTSGGVGPTHDDLTMEGAARAFELGIVRHPELERRLRAFYGERLEERNLRMADVPDGVVLIDGDVPNWPVVALRNVYILPGIPEIFRIKFQSIRERFRAEPFHLRCVFTSQEEGSIAGELDRIVAHFPLVQVGSYPKLDPTEYKVKVTLESKDQASVEAACAELVKALGNSVVRTADRLQISGNDPGVLRMLLNMRTVWQIAAACLLWPFLRVILGTRGDQDRMDRRDLEPGHRLREGFARM